MYRSVLSPADHPGVFSIGASLNQTSLLSSSSRGYRSHSIQRFLPEFIIHGFHIPCFTTSLTCKGISGTSIAAPLFTGLLVLQQQEYLSHHPSLSHLSLGSLHCLLHNQSLSFCSFPSSIVIPSSQVPFIPQPMYSLSYDIILLESSQVNQDTFDSLYSHHNQLQLILFILILLG